MDKYSDIISDGGLDPRNATPQPAAHPFSCICDECCKKPAQASEPVAVVEGAEYQSDNAILNIPLTIGTKLYTTPQPAAECPRCAELTKNCTTLQYACDDLEKERNAERDSANRWYVEAMRSTPNKELQARCAELGKERKRLMKLDQERAALHFEDIAKLTAAEARTKRIEQFWTEKCAKLEKFRFRLGDMRSANVAILQAKLTAAEELLAECETALQQVPDGWRHLGIPKILAKLAARKGA